MGRMRRRGSAGRVGCSCGFAAQEAVVFDKFRSSPYNMGAMALRNSIHFSVLGGGGEVGANCFEIRANGHSILLDSGTHPKKEGLDALPEFRLLNRTPEALLVSHGHVDHCGSVPYLTRQFPGVRTHTTVPTVRIMDRMLHNSVAVMKTIAQERGVRDYPLYDHDEVKYAMGTVQGHEFGAPFDLGLEVPVEVSFRHAGHVLGSASLLIRMPGHSVLYTGDICGTNQELLEGYQLGDELEADTLVIESTHGATDEEKIRKYGQEALQLGRGITQTLEGGGAVLVPSFALGRTQEMLNIVARLQEEGVIPDVPVYASGLGRAIYEVYNRFQEYLRPDAVLRPLSMFGRIGNVWEPHVVADLISKPCIIVATSGMMLENTPSAMIAEEMVKYYHHGIFFAGYLDHDTLGYKLLHAQAGEALRFCLGRPRVEVKLGNIHRFHFSAHSPRSALGRFIKHVKPKNVVYVHGDGEAIAWMQEHTGNGYRSYAPVVGQTLTLEA